MLYFPNLQGLARTWCHPIILFINNLWLKAARFRNTRYHQKYYIGTAIIIKLFLTVVRKLHKYQDGKLRCKTNKQTNKNKNKNIRPRFQVNLIHDWRIRSINSAFIPMSIKQYQYQRIAKQIKSAMQTYNLIRKWTIGCQQTRSQRWMEHSHQAASVILQQKKITCLLLRCLHDCVYSEPGTDRIDGSIWSCGIYPSFSDHQS